jgi:hypothetical protein
VRTGSVAIHLRKEREGVNNNIKVLDTDAYGPDVVPNTADHARLNRLGLVLVFFVTLIFIRTIINRGKLFVTAVNILPLLLFLLCLLLLLLQLLCCFLFSLLVFAFAILRIFIIIGVSIETNGSTTTNNSNSVNGIPAYTVIIPPTPLIFRGP